MKTYYAHKVLGAEGWMHGVRLSVDNGLFAAIETGASAAAGDEHHDILLPGMSNLHSHAFQRAMAGLGEIRGPGADSFWSWRNVMYKFALTMTPEQVQAVAAQLYMEMLEAGFTRVGEFHYLHHDKDGSPYANIAELAERIGAATAETGIGLTLLPVFYAHSGFGAGAPVEGQRRFINSLESFDRLMAGCRAVVAGLPGGRLGVAPHSLRAVTPEQLAAMDGFADGGPIHIHIAEQVKEVEDCIAWSGARPVEWLLDNAPVDDRWCLIHATHMTADETRRMAESGAVAGLCPITEANLGDGTFPAPDFIAHGGHWGVGSDSNVLIGLPDELRQLEYSQRLAARARNVIAVPNGSTGHRLLDGAVRGGAQALGVASGFAIGASADFLSLRPRAFEGPQESLLDRWIFANGADIDCVWAGGKKRVEGGRHVGRQAIEKNFAVAMRALMES